MKILAISTQDNPIPVGVWDIRSEFDGISTSVGGGTCDVPVKVGG
jgi:hypothetical protein